MWIFFTTNVHDNLTDFMIVGNLGSDGSGTVTEHVFDAVPHTRFVKRECGDEEGDPSVNNMIIIESTQPGPTNSQLRLCPRSTRRWRLHWSFVRPGRSDIVRNCTGLTDSVPSLQHGGRLVYEGGRSPSYL